MKDGGSIAIENNAPGNGLAVLIEAYLFWVLSQGKKKEKGLLELNLTVGIDITDSDMDISVRFAGDKVGCVRIML